MSTSIIDSAGSAPALVDLTRRNESDPGRTRSSGLWAWEHGKSPYFSTRTRTVAATVGPLGERFSGPKALGADSRQLEAYRTKSTQQARHPNRQGKSTAR